MKTAIQVRGVTEGDGDIERARGARRKLRQVKENLISPSPELLEECGPVLAEAADLLGVLLGSGMSRTRVPEFQKELGEELQQLRRELTVVAALMEQAARYYLGWAQMLGAAVGGYTSHGDVPPLTVESRLSLEG